MSDYRRWGIGAINEGISGRIESGEVSWDFEMVDEGEIGRADTMDALVVAVVVGVIDGS